MKKFVLKFLLLLGLIYFLPVLIFIFICPQYKEGYGGAVYDKVARLESLQSPKIILCGNSNVAFGFCSNIIEKEMDMPVVNIGYHAGAGNVFNERLALFNIGKGDIVVLSQLTYDDDDGIGDPELTLVTVENHFHLWKVFRLKDYPRLIQAFPRYAYKCFVRWIKHEDKPSTNEWGRNAFNKYGDMEYMRNSPKEDINLQQFHPGVGKKCIDRLNKYYDYCQSKGATLVIAAPPFMDDEKINSFEEVDEFWSDLKRLSKSPVISDWKNYVYGVDYFWDSNAHLNDEGAVLRTRQLIKDLKNYLGEGR